MPYSTEFDRGSDMAESMKVVIRRFAQVTEVSLHIQGLVKVDT